MAHSYIKSDGKVYTKFTRQGQLLYGPYEMFGAYTSSSAYTLQSCGCGDTDVVVIISDSNLSTYAQKVKLNGTLGEVRQIGTSSNTESWGKCRQLKESLFMFVWQESTPSHSWNINKKVLDIDTGVVKIESETITSYIADVQFHSSIENLQGINQGKIIVAWTGNGDGCTSSSSKALFYSILDSDGNIIQVNSKDSNILGNCAKSNINYISTDEYGGFVIGYNDATTSKLKIISIDNDLKSIRCQKQDGLGEGHYPELTIYQKQIFMTYNDSSAMMANICHIILDLDTCEIPDQYSDIYTLGNQHLFSTNAGNNKGSRYNQLRVVKDTGNAKILSIQYQYTATQDQIDYFEYLIENQSFCDNIYVSDCYLNNQGNICAGTDFKNRMIRQRDDNLQCTCDDLYYHKQGEINCQQCKSGCSTCNNENSCLTCQDTNNLLPSCESTQCPDQYYEQNNTCYKCNIGCDTCSNNIECDSCIDTNNVLPHCQYSVCQFGYYKSGSDCIQCNSECASCLDNISCDTCSNELFLLPLCTSSLCGQGQYSDGLQCLDCQLQCGSCENQQECLTCSNSQYLLPFCISIYCNSGYYKQDEQCYECDIQCKECTESGACTICNNRDYILPECKLSKNGYFAETQIDGSIIYKKCAIQCKNCENDINICTGNTCNGYNRDLSNNCQCISGYHDYNQKFQSCEICPAKCSTCQSQNQCTSCNNNQFRKLNKFTGDCECQKGYKEIENSLICIKCYQFKNNCLDSCPTDYVQNEYTHACEHIEYSLQSNILFIIAFGVIIFIFQILMCLVIKYGLKQQYIKFQYNKLCNKQIQTQSMINTTGINNQTTNQNISQISNLNIQQQNYTTRTCENIASQNNLLKSKIQKI